MVDFFSENSEVKFPRLFANSKLCVGCRICELTCSFVNEQENNPRKSRIRVSNIRPTPPLDLPVFCRHCANPPCVQSCPTGALKKSDNANLLNLELKLCIGCKLCVEACPLGAMTMHPEEDKPLYCNLCGGDPECVKRCPTDALIFQSDVSIAKEKGSQIAKNISLSMK